MSKAHQDLFILLTEFIYSSSAWLFNTLPYLLRGQDDSLHLRKYFTYRRKEEYDFLNVILLHFPLCNKITKVLPKLWRISYVKCIYLFQSEYFLQSLGIFPKLMFISFSYTRLHITKIKGLTWHVTAKEMITWQVLTRKENPLFDHQIVLICLVMRFLNQAETDY